MEEKPNSKSPNVAAKSFMTVGPTLHYSHENVQRCWVLALLAFILTCLCFSKIVNGSFLTFKFSSLLSLQAWRLGQFVTTGVSIFEYPLQILVLAMLMGILAMVPILIAQLMSFSYSLLFIFAIALLANLPGLAVFVLVCSLAAASRPLRFRSRFIAIALCSAPLLLYWGYFGSISGLPPVKWAFSFAPWIGAWLFGLTMAGLVLGIGHFTRYRPGLVWAFTALFLVSAVGIFETTIGFDELDYQLYVARYNPKQVNEFRDHSVTAVLDEIVTNPSPRVKRYLQSSFYPTEPIPLRAELKKKINAQLRLCRWPGWLSVPEQLRYQDKREWLFKRYDQFINHRKDCKRMPVALYFKAMLSELTPDITAFDQKELLAFYSDYPYERSRDTWYWLYTDFADSPESLEARWRIAMHWIEQARFEQADELLKQTQILIAEHLENLQVSKKIRQNTLLEFFQPTPDSVITASDLSDLNIRTNLLRVLISEENRPKRDEEKQKLAAFIMLNQHAPEYSQRIDELLTQLGENSRLEDDILLAQIKIIADEKLRAEKFSQLHQQFKDTDGGMLALYELALLKTSFYQNETNVEQKKTYLAQTRETLKEFIRLYPDSFWAEQFKENLENLPAN
ncbi:hypothetical protein ACFL3G_12505 [Planctomycetota bacterium]